MLESGFSSSNASYSVTLVHCTACGKHIGEQGMYGGVPFSDFEDWEFCPYCGKPLYEGT